MPLDPSPVPQELRGLRIALLVAGGIAAYKLADLASALTQAGSEVRVAMTSSAARFVGPPTFQGVTGHPVLTSVWPGSDAPEPHVFLGDWAQVILLAPATAGATREPIDPVRFISNYSSGKMGFAIAAAAADRGARVTLVSAAAHEEHRGVEVHHVETAQEMLDQLRQDVRGADLLVMAAAVADFRPAKTATGKIRREETPKLNLELEPVGDLIAAVAEDPVASGVFIVGFAAESSEVDAHAQEKLKRKRLQAIVANDISRKDIGFGSEYNEGVMLFADGTRQVLERTTKRVMADRILDLVLPKLR